jgi:hypothetical protein
MGTSATGAAALRRLCRFVGCDTEQMYVDASELRLSREWDNILNQEESTRSGSSTEPNEVEQQAIDS